MGLISTPHETCRSCRGPLDPLFTLGNLYLSTFLKPGAPKPPQVPLELTICRDCELVQLRDTTNPELLYRQYWYRSGINETMRAELRDIVDRALCLVERSPGMVVVDIGANDGTLLQHYESLQPRPIRVAYEPAHNLYDQLRPHAEVLVPDYFPSEQLHGEILATIITSIACFYDLEDPHEFVAAIRELLAPRGVWVLQFQDLLSMVRATAYDNLCHEHLIYYSLTTLEKILASHGLEIIKVEERAINGGSLRFYVGHAETGWTIDPSVAKQREVEKIVLTWDRLQHFAWEVEQHKTQLSTLVGDLVSGGHVVDLYAASTKAQTLLQACGLDDRHIRWAVERSPEKVGLEMVTGIPIQSEETWRANPGSMCLLGAWQFKKVFLQRERAYLEQGGIFLVPLPSVEVVLK